MGENKREKQTPNTMTFSLCGAVRGAIMGAVASSLVAALGFTSLLAIPAVGATLGAIKGAMGAFDEVDDER